MKKGIFQVELICLDKKVQVKGFYDSGNRLKDPYTGKGVHIVSEQLIRKFKIQEIRTQNMETNPEEIKRVYIPYQSLGNEAGLLEVYYIDELVIDGEKERIYIHNCPLGVTKDNLFEGKEYEIILNEEVF